MRKVFNEGLPSVHNTAIVKGRNANYRGSNGKKRQQHLEKADLTRNRQFIPTDVYCIFDHISHDKKLFFRNQARQPDFN